VAASPKHFAANSQELRRMHSDSVLDERTLRELYLTAFEIAVKEGKPLSLMSSYNRVNGVYANENPLLLRDILVTEWGFEGFVVSDWGGSNDRVEGLKAGNHLEMPATGGNSTREIVEAVREGRIPEALLDRRLEEYLRVLFAVQIPPDTPKFDVSAHHTFARRAAGAAIVLLKNEGPVLPLKRGAAVAVIGDFARNPRYQGFGSSLVNPTKVDTPLDCLAESGLNITGFEAGYRRHGGEDLPQKKAAVELAKQTELVLLYMGQDELFECEGMDRDQMELRQNQTELLEAVYAVNPNIVVVLSGGSPVEIPWLDKCKALIHGYLGGQAGAGAMAEALTGGINPSGKLAETWPLVYQDSPAARYFPGRENTAEYREGPFCGYRYYRTAKIPVRFPFGFGLSYTTFAYSGLKAGEQEVTVTITNTGALAGAEIVQVYVSAKESKIFRPAGELKGFAKVYLLPGESSVVTIPLDDKAFRYYNRISGKFEIEGGPYTVQVGASSEDIRLTGEVFIQGTQAPLPYDPAALPSYYGGRIADVGGQEFEALLGRPVSPADWDRSKPLELNDTFSQLFYAKSPVSRLVYKILTAKKDKAAAQGKLDLNILFIYNMPFRGIAKMMGGAVDMAMAGALLEIFNGRFFTGLGHLAGAWLKKGRAAKNTTPLKNRKTPDSGPAPHKGSTL
jgi:beta-glucosidase